MSKSIVYQGQSFLNKVIENTGSVENAFEMALLNGISITDDIVIGTMLKVSPVTDKQVESFFDKDNKPATLLTAEQLLSIESLGIGSMIIETNFIVQ